MRDILLDHQFQFRHKHFAIDQIQRFVNTIATTTMFENREYCCLSEFLNGISQSMFG